MKKNISKIFVLFFLCFIFIFLGWHNLTDDKIITDPDNWVNTGHDSLHIRTFRSADVTNQPNLIIVIHGDAPFNNPGYQYKMAQLLSKENQNTIAIGLLRPGYTDPDNVHSPGKKGLATGDNYTAEIIDNIAAAIKSLKKLYHPVNTIIAGHSGGSAIAADIIGRYLTLADAAVIVSCPCNVPAWRAYMKTLQKDTHVWDKRVESLSPPRL